MIKPNVYSLLEKLRTRIDEKLVEAGYPEYSSKSNDEFTPIRVKIDNLEKNATDTPNDPQFDFIQQYYDDLLKEIENIKLTKKPPEDEEGVFLKM